MADEFSADTADLDAFVDRARLHERAMASTHARLVAQRSALADVPTSRSVEGSVVALYRELAEQMGETASLAAAVSASLQEESWTDRIRTAARGSWRITSTLPNHPAFAVTLATDPGSLLPRYRSTALGVSDWASGIAELGNTASSAIPGSPRFIDGLRQADGDPAHHPAARFVAGLADVGDDLTSLIPGTRAFNEELDEAAGTRSLANHAGLTIAGRLAASALDWETFRRDPNRWFGRVAPDIVIDAATAGWAGRGSVSDDLARGLDDTARSLDDVAHGIDDVAHGIDDAADLAEAGAVAQRAEIVESKAWRTFDRDLDQPFLDLLDDFGGDHYPPSWLRGGEGQLFLSERHPTRAVKRWHRSRLDELDRSVEALIDAREAVRADPDVAAVLEVVEVHDRGPDWILRDYDPESKPLKKLLRAGDPRAERAMGEAIEALNGKPDPSLRTILERLDRPRPSANVHWSDRTGRLVIIDMM